MHTTGKITHFITYVDSEGLKDKEIPKPIK
jgi:hypothetical protein